MPSFNEPPKPPPAKLNGNGRHPKQNIKADLESTKKQHEKAIDNATSGSLPPRIIETRCHTCNSEFRDYIEREVLRGHSYKAISQSIGGTPDRRSISTHHKEHMAITAAAYRAILEEEASLEGQNFQEGVKGAITNRGILEIMIRKGFDDIIDDNSIVEPKDLIQIIKLKQEMDANYVQVQVETYKRQVEIFKQAILEVVPPDMQTQIVSRVKRIRQREDDAVLHENLLSPGPIVDAEVVE